MYDLHIHTAFSPDSAMTMSEAARAAESAGLDGICFTDHVDIDYPYHDWKCDLDLSRYLAAVESA
ncbi:MAG: PHP domain-containing protein, partial [Bacillota bacterium]|nr:PHP domain-containing protein [Bacillota bacterium]